MSNKAYLEDSEYRRRSNVGFVAKNKYHNLKDDTKKYYLYSKQCKKERNDDKIDYDRRMNRCFDQQDRNMDQISKLKDELRQNTDVLVDVKKLLMELNKSHDDHMLSLRKHGNTVRGDIHKLRNLAKTMTSKPMTSQQNKTLYASNTDGPMHASPMHFKYGPLMLEQRSNANAKKMVVARNRPVIKEISGGRNIQKKSKKSKKCSVCKSPNFFRKISK